VNNGLLDMIEGYYDKENPYNSYPRQFRVHQHYLICSYLAMEGYIVKQIFWIRKLSMLIIIID
jgi:hypothetical protein